MSKINIKDDNEKINNIIFKHNIYKNVVDDGIKQNKQFKLNKIYFE